MSRQALDIPGHVHFLTFSCYRGHQFLTEVVARALFVRFLERARAKHEFHLWAYVIMPEHVHLLIHPRTEAYSTSGILRDVKEPVAQRMVSHWRKADPARIAMMTSHQGRREIRRFWQAGGGFDRNLTHLDAVAKAIDYIEWNPVRRGLVSEPALWQWSSAQARAGYHDVPIKVDQVAFDIGYDVRKP